MDRKLWSKDFPNLLLEWNENQSPVGFSCSKKAHWKCSKGHEWQTTPHARFSHNNGCPYCYGRMPSLENNLLSVFPLLARQWHPLKNIMNPDKFTPKSSKKVWWMCEYGHEWEAKILDRAYGSGCPYCSGNRARPDNCLSLFPDIVKELHPEKNDYINPNLITPKSGKKLWWICCKGHSWKTTVQSRTNGNGCPFCHSQTSKIEIRLYCEIGSVFNTEIEWKYKRDGVEFDIFLPAMNLAVEFDGAYWHKDAEKKDKNKNMSAEKFGILLLRVREKPLDKLCDIDIIVEKDENHLDVCKKTITKISEIIGFSNLCYDNFLEQKKYDSVVASIRYPRNSLEKKAAHISADWNYKRNGIITPENVSHKSSENVWWICPKGHEWKAIIYSRVNGNGCPYCAKKHYKNREDSKFI